MNLLRTALTSLRKSFLAGLLVLGPAYLCIRGGDWLLRQLDAMFLPPLLEALGEPTRPPFILGAAATLVLVTLAGMAARSVVGRGLVTAWDRVVARVPVVSSLYALLHQFFSAVFGEQQQAFRRVVLVEYPRRGLFSYAFVTGEDAVVEGEPGLHLFVPSTPNPTTGFYLLARTSEVVATELSVDDAFRLIITAGIARPTAKAIAARSADVSIIAP